MTKIPSADLFSISSTTSGFAMTEDEAMDAVVRARNAALQMPLNHLDANRDRLSVGGVYLFEEINPMQVAQQFLAIVGKAMLEDGIERQEAVSQLAAYIGLFRVVSPLSSANAEAAATRVIDIVRNRHEDFAKFSEFYHDPLTGVRHEYLFQLVEGKSRRDGTEVFKLTTDGAKLLLVNWSAKMDIDVIGMLVERALQTGQFGASLLHLERVKASSIEIAAKLSDIDSQLKRMSYNKGFGEEIGGLLEQVQVEIETFQANHARFKKAFEWARDSGDGDVANRAELAMARSKLDDIFKITGQLKALVKTVMREYSSLQDKLLSEIGFVLRLPDIPNEVLRRVIVQPLEKLDEMLFAETCFSLMLPVVTERHYDPFALLDTVRIGERRETVPEAEAVDLEPDTDIYTPSEQIRAQGILEDFIEDSSDGVSLSDIYRSVMADETLLAEPMLVQCILHRAVLFDPGEDWKVTKTPTGEWIENDYFESVDFVIKKDLD